MESQPFSFDNVGVLCQLELFEETQVVFEEQTQVVDLVFQHGDTLDTHAEGKTCVFLWVNAARNQDVRVAHAAA